MRKITFLFSVLIISPILLLAQPKIQLQDWASGFSKPLDITHCGDSRIFVVQQVGVIRVLDSLGNHLDTFLNIDPRVNSVANERGLLGLAFHPDYLNNGYFFVHYSSSNGSTQVSRFSVKADNPNQADPDSELSILTASQPFNNHNGGCIKFGPDGYLYIGLGDGGSGGDPQDNGQKKSTFLGKILRIDVNNSDSMNPYVVPADNPFVGQSEYLPEIWSLGWRNPWRFSFDRLTGDMWVGDVGQVTREEVDFEPAGMGGRNYGWRCYEGTLPYNTANCQPQNSYVGPVFDYDNNSVGCSMTGGFVYRGSKYTDLYGLYLNADYCSGRIWATKHHDDDSFSTEELANLGNNEFSSFGEGADGELYIALHFSGKVQRITELCSPFQVTASEIISPVCEGTNAGSIQLEVENGTNVSFMWSNGQTNSKCRNLNPGTYTATVTNADGCSRVQTYEIEQGGPNPPDLMASDSVFCIDESIVLTASGLSIPNQLNWYHNAVLIDSTFSNEPNYSIEVTEPGSYYVLAADSLCAFTSNPIVLTNDSLLTPQISQSGDTLYSDMSCTNCQWLMNGQPIPGATDSLYIALVSGTYSLEVTSPNGCTYLSPEIQLVISEAILPTSVLKFSLSPNPTFDTMLLNMELAKKERFTLSLVDGNQRQLFMQTHQQSKISLPIQLEALPAGTYFLKVDMESGKFIKKLVKQ
ncbi:MAG: PQQ-dependent sugar dehydrogenase [Lewinellaceae bacterium]|nr:PQQ-dependent sugar dehydrogenase [Saprospiraceae bacterium]MCB9344804.1 PQQ-dependent sugar dehydrogenase [Lewinellaceae bacterium]